MVLPATEFIDPLPLFPQGPKTLPNWVVWRLEPSKDGSKPRKVPYNPQCPGEKAKINDRTSWATYEEAVRVLQAQPLKFAGVSFAVTADCPYTVIDLDHCADLNGELSAAAHEIVKQQASYTEYSPSSTGVHIWLLSKKPQNPRCKADWIECYDSGRFITVTGRRDRNSPAEIGPGAIVAFLDKYLPVEIQAPVAAPDQGTRLTDQEILDKAHAARGGARFRDLYDYGNWQAHYPSQSEADLTLAGELMFWAGNDSGQADRLFRGSALYRSKWDERRGRQTYGQQTLDKARQANVYGDKDDRRKQLKLVGQEGHAPGLGEERPRDIYSDRGRLPVTSAPGPEPAGPVKRSLKISDLRKRPKQEYFDHYPFPRRRKTFIWGASGTGKTALIIDAMMYAVAVEGLYIYCIVPSEECAEEYLPRIDEWVTQHPGYNIKPQDLEEKITWWNDDISLDFRNPACVDMIKEEVGEQYFDVLVIDTMAALLPGIKDADNGDFSAFFKRLGEIQRIYGPDDWKSVWILGHANKKGEYKSASAIKDSVDAMFGLVEIRKDYVQLLCEKMRTGQKPKSITFHRAQGATSLYLERVGEIDQKDRTPDLTQNQYAVLDIFTLEPYREAVSREALEKNLDIKAGPEQKQLSMDIDKLISVGYIGQLDSEQIKDLKRRGLNGNMRITDAGAIAYEEYREKNGQPQWNFDAPVDASLQAGVHTFARLNLAFDPDGWEQSDELYSRYKAFCQAANTQFAVFGSASTFIAQLRKYRPGVIVPERKYVVERKGKVGGVSGIKLK